MAIELDYAITWHEAEEAKRHELNARLKRQASHRYAVMCQEDAAAAYLSADHLRSTGHEADAEEAKHYQWRARVDSSIGRRELGIEED